MLEYDFEHSIGAWVCGASHALERAMMAELRPEGVTFRQCQVLFTLAMHGEQSQAELAAFMSIEPPTLTGVLARMERDGWIERVPCPADGRKKIVRSLPAAESAWSRIVAAAHRVRERATAGIDPDEMNALRATLERVRANLEAEAPTEVTR